MNALGRAAGAAQANPAAAPKSVAAATRLRERWPALKAASAAKPPFSRVFTAFGAAEGEPVAH
jgi:hypothetical protein